MATILLCEGSCSPQLAHVRDITRCMMDPRERAMLETKALRYQPHAFQREVKTKQSTHQFWACATCGHERVWG